MIYLDLNIEDMTPRHADDDTPIAELAILDKEMNTTFLQLPVVHADNNVASCIVTSWDSSIHDSIHLNRLTPHNERIYMIVKAYIKLSHPAPVDVTLRKRICVNVYKHQSLTMKLRKKINKTATVSFNIVLHINWSCLHIHSFSKDQKTQDFTQGAMCTVMITIKCLVFDLIRLYLDL